MSFVENTYELIAILKDSPGALEKYAELHKNRIERTARDLVQCADDNLMHELRGQLSICFEQYDAAIMALNEKAGKANPADTEEIP